MDDELEGRGRKWPGLNLNYIRALFPEGMTKMEMNFSQDNWCTIL
jgi:hypothetical protein